MLLTCSQLYNQSKKRVEYQSMGVKKKKFCEMASQSVSYIVVIKQTLVI